ncbi:hypothetical protein RND71_017862 [Anisodus tanguticus]|uniref:Uncharacterized protein n=1 Tax=Anisodus tanguticus TaxID=243964 RepID=A0AAE1VGE2_9SOLA|nr:hypothetical protein RND71_017862 [Anisodus tanguticus]
MVLGDEKEGMQLKLEKKSKKCNKHAATSALGVTAADVKAEEGDFSFDEEKLAVSETRKERDKEAMETKAAGENDVCDIKRKKKRGGKCSGKSNKNSDEGAVKSVEKKKKNKLKKSSLDEPLDTSASALASASETRDSDKVVETLGEVSGGNTVDKIKRKKKSKKNTKTAATNGVGVTNTDVKAKSDDCDIKREKKKNMENILGSPVKTAMRLL